MVDEYIDKIFCVAANNKCFTFKRFNDLHDTNRTRRLRTSLLFRLCSSSNDVHLTGQVVFGRSELMSYSRITKDRTSSRSVGWLVGLSHGRRSRTTHN